MTILWCISISMRTQILRRNSTRFMTCGSSAASSTVVLPVRNAAIMSIFSVAVTAKFARRCTSLPLSAHWNAIFSHSPIFVYPYARNAERCSSIGRFPMLHPPGYGISSAPNLFRSAGKRNIPTRIFLIFSRSRCSIERLELSIVIVLPTQVILDQRDSIIDRNVSTSQILGTLWSVKVSKKSPTAMSGSAAFLDPDIWTVPERFWGQVILSKRVILVTNSWLYSIRRILFYNFFSPD